MTAASLKHAVRRWRGHYHATMFTIYLAAAVPLAFLGSKLLTIVYVISIETAMATHLAGWAADDAAPTADELEEQEIP